MYISKFGFTIFTIITFYEQSGTCFHMVQLAYEAIKEEDQEHDSTLRADTEPVTRAGPVARVRYRKSVTADNSNQDVKDL